MKRAQGEFVPPNTVLVPDLPPSAGRTIALWTVRPHSRATARPVPVDADRGPVPLHNALVPAHCPEALTEPSAAVGLAHSRT